MAATKHLELSYNLFGVAELEFDLINKKNKNKKTIHINAGLRFPVFSLFSYHFCMESFQIRMVTCM